jgi:hypothetical protein
MRGAKLPFPQYAFMAWFSVESTGTTLPYFYLFTPNIFHIVVPEYKCCRGKGKFVPALN